MSSGSRRQFLRELADNTRRSEALLAPREIGDEISYPGVGTLLVSVAHIPSFGTARLWEVRSSGDELLAYISQAQQPDSRLVLGHTKLGVPQEVLAQQVNALVGQTLSVTPHIGDFGVADADVFLAKIGMGFLTNCTLSWCEGCEPESWKPTIEKMIRLKNLLEGSQAIEQPAQVD